MLERSGSRLDDVFRALANPHRRAMISRLTVGPTSLSDLALPFDMTLSAVEQHFKVLEGCALARSEKHGRVRTCYLEPETIRRAEHWLSEHRKSWERRLDRLGDFLDDPTADAEEMK